MTFLKTSTILAAVLMAGSAHAYPGPIEVPADRHPASSSQSEPQIRGLSAVQRPVLRNLAEMPIHDMLPLRWNGPATFGQQGPGRPLLTH